MLKPPAVHSTGNHSRTMSRFGLGLFSLAFSIPGLAIAVGIALYNWQCYRQMDWKVVPAEVLDLPERASELKERGALQYRFVTQGQSVEVRDGQDHLPSLLSEERKMTLHEAIRAAKAAGTAIPCWVNPRSTAEHTLAPVRPSLVTFFMGIFTFSHGLLGILLFLVKRQGQAEEALGHSASRAGRYQWLWLLASLLIVNAFALPSVLSLWLSSQSEVASLPEGPSIVEDMGDTIPSWLAWILVLLPLFAFRIWWRTLRKMQLERGLYVTPSGGQRPGEDILLRLSQTDGGFMLPNELQTSSGWELRCVETHDDRGQNQLPNASTLATIPLEAMMEGGAVMRLSGTLPISALPSGENLHWELCGKTAGNLKLGPFIIPVQDSDPAAEGESEAGPAQVQMLLIAEQIQTHRDANGDEIWEFPSNRFPTVARTLRVVVGVCVFVAMGLVIYFLSSLSRFTVAGALIALVVTAVVAGVILVMHNINLPRRVTLDRGI